MHVDVNKLRRPAPACLFWAVASGSHSTSLRFRNQRINALRGDGGTSFDAALKIDSKEVAFLGGLSIGASDVKVTPGEGGSARKEGDRDGGDGGGGMQVGGVQMMGGVAAKGEGTVGVGDESGDRAGG